MIQSWTFWAVLAVAVPCYWLLPVKLRPWLVFVVSFGYLASLDAVSVALLLLWSVAFYALAPMTAQGDRRGRAVFAALLLGILGYLAAFKYVPPILAAITGNAAATNLMVPLGISYFTFKLIHYAIESSRGKIPERSLAKFLGYMYLFPIFTAGPIERYDHFLANIEEKWSLDSMVFGLTRIAHGLIKKLVVIQLVIVPLMGGIDAARVVRTIDRLDTTDAWLYCIGTYLVVYLDFSAYSDIAIGASRLFGLQIMENFYWPIFAANISEFWKRWHMTLSGWCQTYVYMPLIGATRNPYLAILATFTAIGLWHAGSLNYLAWGLYHAAGVATIATWSRYRRPRRGGTAGSPGIRYVGIALTFAFVSSSMALSSLDGIGTLSISLRLLARLVGLDL